jgi:tRNA 5-methylaminomethyl-2-thiouridine biosynthesis bifunctional protein
MKGAPRSELFDDVYFSAHDGFAETLHVFLEGNDLPERWAGKERFVIAETGFGTGLNFLAAWSLFEATTAPNQKLDFISFEKFPLDREEIELHLQPWKHEFPELLATLLKKYPLLVPGFHRAALNERVSLTLVFDDVNKAVAQLETPVDAWFLDGFKPSTNPDMWSATVFENMARLSKEGSTFSTFTAAGEVKRGLSAAGFDVQKVPGFGTKRDMLTGTFKGPDQKDLNQGAGK